jgi:hypothetical protein
VPPLSTIAPWKRPRAGGDCSSANTSRPPALSPKIVTLSGLPPNTAMFFFTQRSAWIRSSVP